jgi:hypothetical protein
MTLTIPTCERFSTVIERAVRSLAPVLVWVYCLGYACGRILHNWNDWLAGKRQRQAPTVTVVTVPTPKPVATFAEILASEGIKPLTPAELEAEIAAFDAAQPSRKRPAARRKTAGATRVKAPA